MNVNAHSGALAQQQIAVRYLGLEHYTSTWARMKSFSAERTDQTADEIWLVQHPPIYTLGVAARTQHLPRGRDDIELLRVDRGGQITYHGPGQVVAYMLIDMTRRRLTVRSLVRRIEQAVIDLLAQYGIDAARRIEAPGVYVRDAKIAALGLRIKRGCSYHGLALNVDMDLTPFHAIDPCGYPGLAVAQLKDFGVRDAPQRVSEKLARELLRVLT